MKNTLKMKLTDKWHLWDIRREIKFHERKIKFLKLLLKHFKKEYENGK